MFTRKNIGLLLNIIVGLASFTGVILGFINATNEGFNHFSQRLLYFTTLSNIWIGVVCILISIGLILENILKKEVLKNSIYVLKYIFTISITVTGIVFCFLLAPFADFNVWTASSILTHVVVPVTAVMSYFVEVPLKPMNKKYVWFSLIPPFVYFIFGIILSAFKVDFGRGQTYPYFFMNFESEVGLFGFKTEGLFEMGCVYWIIIILLFILGISRIYYKLHSVNKKNEK